MKDFYDQLAPYYHLIFEDWETAIASQADHLAEIIRTEWGPQMTRVLDVACGIGTQSLGLAARGFRVTASDLSHQAITLAKQEADVRNLKISFSICDMRALSPHHGSGFDVVICAGNSIPHLLSDSEILIALKEMHACLRPEGGCLITIRPYDQEPRGQGIFKPFGIRQEGNQRYTLFQIWDFIGELYDFSMYIIQEDVLTGAVETHILRSRYYAISPDQLSRLMQQAGFESVKRVDNHQNHPAILVGTKMPQRSSRVTGQ